MIFLKLCSISYAKYIEIICQADSEWKSDSNKRDKIWFKLNKPKYIFHFDEENLVMLKMGISKDTSEVENINANVEKIKDSETVDSFNFHTSANVSLGESIINEFTLFSYNQVSLNNRFGLFFNQYRMHPDQLTLIGKEMKNDTFTELTRARLKIAQDTLIDYEPIRLFGGQEGICEASLINK